MRRYVLMVPAGTSEEFKLVGDYIRIKSAAVALIIESPDTGETVELEEGDAAKLTRFERLRLSHSNATAVTVTLFIGANGTEADSAKVGGSVSVSGTVAISVPTVATAYGDITINPGSLSAIGPTTGRQELHVHNSSGELLRWGGLGGVPGAAAGAPIMPGMTLVITLSGQIFFYNAGSNPATIMVSEVVW